jgi:hypothetical protein
LPAREGAHIIESASTGIHWPALDYQLSVDGLLSGAHEAEGVTRRETKAAQK